MGDAANKTIAISHFHGQASLCLQQLAMQICAVFANRMAWHVRRKQRDNTDVYRRKKTNCCLLQQPFSDRVCHRPISSFAHYAGRDACNGRALSLFVSFLSGAAPLLVVVDRASPGPPSCTVFWEPIEQMSQAGVDRAGRYFFTLYAARMETAGVARLGLALKHGQLLLSSENRP